MTLYSVVLFVHILAVLPLVSAFSFEALTLARLRRATNLSEARLWVDLVPRLPLMAISSLLVLLLSGGYLTAQMSAWSLGWPKVAVATLVLISPLGAITARRMRGIRRGMAQQGGNESTLLGRLNDPFLKFSLHVRVWVVAGIVLLKAAKPDLTTSVVIIGASTILGCLSALPGTNRGGTLSAVGSDAGR